MRSRAMTARVWEKRSSQASYRACCMRVATGAAACAALILGGCSAAVQDDAGSGPGAGSYPTSGAETSAAGADGNWRHVQSGQVLPADAIQTGFAGESRFFTCRALYNGRFQGGMAFVDGICDVGVDGQEHQFTDFDVLVGSSYAWQPAKALGVIPAFAIAVGADAHGLSLYGCRADYMAGVYPGQQVGGQCAIGYWGSEIRVDTFEVLLHSSDAL